MLLTKECDYGVRVIRVLADGAKKTVAEICEAERIPGQYAYKILKKLERAGFLRILRGCGGGYELVKPLNTFTLYDVITAIEDKIFIFECLRDDKFCPFKIAQQPCAVHNEYERIQKMLADELRGKTMDEVLSQAGGPPA